MLGASNFFMPIFEEALEAYQLPLELKYLPIIESALKPNAVSRVGATGLWQFMLTTGKDYGLTINSLVDERRDPLKASYAAARYLRDLYKIFGDWSLVIAAYNCGPANINKAIHRAGGEKDYWKIYPYLPKETRGYVPAFIAANYVMNYYCEHNICPMKSQLPVQTDTVVVTRNINLYQIAGVLGIEISILRSLNPAYRRDIVPGNTEPSIIHLLPGDAVKFIDLQDSIYHYNEAELLNKRDVVPVTADAVYAQKRGKAHSSHRGKTVTVRKGDNLGAIARRNGTTVAQLRKLNGIKGNNIRAGQKIRVK
jgi:membrane-bound lytic murein transglycosylase D